MHFGMILSVQATAMVGQLAYHVVRRTYGATRPDSVPSCSTADMLPESLRSGTRTYEDSGLSDDLKMEDAAVSWLQPHGQLQVVHMARGLLETGKISQVTFVGDSMLRHIHPGLLMLLG